MVAAAAANRHEVARQLADAITSASSPAEAVAATRVVLALGGIATKSHGDVLVPARAPRAGYAALPVETVTLADEARHRASLGTLTLTEFGTLLTELGFPFAEGTAPATALTQLFATWVRAAQAAPQDPLAFTPLFLQAMAGHQVPAVDLAAGTMPPERVRLTLLELQLLLNAFELALQDTTAPVRAQATPPATLILAAWAPSPCAAVKEALTKDHSSLASVPGVLVPPGSSAGEEAVKSTVNEAIKDWVKRAFGDRGAKQYGRGRAAIDNIGKLAKLAAFYRYALVEVGAFSRHGPLTTLHKQQGAYGTRIWFEATVRAALPDETASPPDAQWQAILDCARLAGLPTHTTLKDVGRVLERWRVDWDLVSDPKHAYWAERLGGRVVSAFEVRGRQVMRLTRVSDTEARAGPFTVVVTPEEQHRGTQEATDVTVVAKVEMDDPREAIKAILGTIDVAGIVGVMQGDDLPTPEAMMTRTISSIITVLANWFAHVVNPTSYSTVTVTYHVPDTVMQAVLEVRSQATGPGGLSLSAHGDIPISIPEHQGEVATTTGLTSLTWTPRPGCRFEWIRSVRNEYRVRRVVGDMLEISGRYLGGGTLPPARIGCGDETPSAAGLPHPVPPTTDTRTFRLPIQDGAQLQFPYPKPMAGAATLTLRLVPRR